MADKEFSKADALVYFTGSPERKREPSELQDIEKIELNKFLKEHVPEDRRRDLVALIERLCELPTYAFAQDVARDFRCGGFFARLKFTRNLFLLVEEGLLIKPVRSVLGLSPKILLELGFLDEFLGKADRHKAEELWRWVREEIRKIETTQTNLKKLGISVSK